MTKPARCPTCKRLKRRSNPANARYWLLLHLIAEKVRPEGEQYSPESFHVFFKQRFLGSQEIKMPNGKVIQIPNSTAELDTAEFHEYAYKVEEWAGEREIYLEEMAA